MRTRALAIVMATIVVFVWNRLLAARGAAADGAPVGTSLTYGLQIEHTWWEQDADSLDRISGFSLGTAIGAHTLLTHNHFSQPGGEGSGEMMKFVDVDGHEVELAVADLILQPMDDGTLLIHIPGYMSLNSAPVADCAAIGQLGLGDWLTVSYWNDDAAQFAQQDFMILRVQDGLATLLDPERRINPGDSGGGAYFHGQLVGNTWLIYKLFGNIPIGAFQVALLPSLVAGCSGEQSDWDLTSPGQSPFDSSSLDALVAR